MTSAANAKRLATAAALVLLAPVGDDISALMLTAIRVALLTLLAAWELQPTTVPGAARIASP
jgi:hypothetical protein